MRRQKESRKGELFLGRRYVPIKPKVLDLCLGASGDTGMVSEDVFGNSGRRQKWTSMESVLFHLRTDFGRWGSIGFYGGRLGVETVGLRLCSYFMSLGKSLNLPKL